MDRQFKVIGFGMYAVSELGLAMGLRDHSLLVLNFCFEVSSLSLLSYLPASSIGAALHTHFPVLTFPAFPLGQRERERERERERKRERKLEKGLFEELSTSLFLWLTLSLSLSLCVSFSFPFLSFPFRSSIPFSRMLPAFFIPPLHLQ
ncbi:hypothetical protein HDK64DRAFT_91395 [Phyllosticta capitalensis]